MKPLLIVNPSAGGGRAGRTFGELRPIVERVLGPVDVETTRASGHAIAIASAAAAEGRELVIALGGDGTLHEVANGVLGAEQDGHRGDRTAIGFIAHGTGGDFRKSLVSRTGSTTTSTPLPPAASGALTRRAPRSETPTAPRGRAGS